MMMMMTYEEVWKINDDVWKNVEDLKNA